MLQRGSQSTLGYALWPALKSDFEIWQIALGLFFPFTCKSATIVLLRFNFVETSTVRSLGCLIFIFY